MKCYISLCRGHFFLSNIELYKNTWRKFKNCFLQKHKDNFNQTCHKPSKSTRGFKFIQMKSHAHFQGEIITDPQKKHWWNFKIVFCRTIGPISTKLGTKWDLMQFVTFNAPFHSQKGDNDPPPPLWKKGACCVLHLWVC